MKRSLAEMAEAAKAFGRKKFARLSPKKQHALLAAFALDTLKHGRGLTIFLKRYHELQSWANIDRFDPPSWLSENETLHDFFAFHQYFAPGVVDHEKTVAEEAKTLSWSPVYPFEVAFGQVRSPYNVGSMLRIIDNFGFKGLVHSSPWLRKDHPQVIKAARGCQKWIPMRFVKDLPSYLSNVDGPVIGIENNPGAVSISKWDPPERGILVVGNEACGIAESILAKCDQTIYIPMAGFKNAMNVHHALSIVGWKICEKGNP